MKRTLIMAGLCASSIALAGGKASYPVGVDLTNKRAWGSLGSARNSADTSQFIGCYTQTKLANQTYTSTSGIPTSFGVCVAQDAAGNYLSCSTQRPDLMALIQSITPNSYVSFTVGEEIYCSFIYIGTYSTYEVPK